jgi:hypothetical protein
LVETAVSDCDPIAHRLHEITQPPSPEYKTIYRWTNLILTDSVDGTHGHADWVNLELWCGAVTFTVIFLLLMAAYIGVYDLGFRSCRKVGRFRSDFNLRVLSVVNEYKTCRFLNLTLVR